MCLFVDSCSGNAAPAAPCSNSFFHLPHPSPSRPAQTSALLPPLFLFLALCTYPLPQPSHPHPDNSVHPVGLSSRLPSAARLPEWCGRAEPRFTAAAARTEPRPPLPLHPRKVSRRIPGKDPHPPFFLRFMVPPTRNGAPSSRTKAPLAPDVGSALILRARPKRLRARGGRPRARRRVPRRGSRRGPGRR